MSKTQEALKLALEALEYIDLCDNDRDFLHPHECFQLDEAITAIREALADIGNPITEQLSLPTGITCPFCSSEHIPGWLHDYNMDRGAYGEQPAIKQDLTPEQPAMFDPSVGTQVSKECKLKEKTSD